MRICRDNCALKDWCFESACSGRLIALCISSSDNPFHVLFVGHVLIACPLIFAVEPFYHSLGKDFLEVAQQDDVILAMEVNPAGIAALGMLALYMDGLARVKYLVQRVLMYIAEFYAQVLAQRHITIRMNDQFAEYALASQFQMAVSPLFIQSYKVEILFCLMNIGRNALYEVAHVSLEQIGCSVEEIHRSINADADIYLVFLCHTYHIVHILEGVPWRKAEHQRNGNLIFQGLNHFYHLVMTIATSHCFVCVFVTVQRHIQMAGTVSTHSINNLLWVEAIGQ